MDDLAAALLATLKKSSATTENKLDLFNKLKSSIKHQNIPESAQPAVFECIRLAIASQVSPVLVTTGLSTFLHLNKRLKCQESYDALSTQVPRFIPIFLERLGDHRENTRSASLQCLCELWTTRPTDVERAIREGALTSTNVRTKEAGIQWVAKMHKDAGLQFRSFVPLLVDCLEDAEGTIREAAKASLIELFRSSSDRAKADLKRQLVAHGVRHSISSFILSQLDGYAASVIELKDAPLSNATEKVPLSKACNDQAVAEALSSPAHSADHIDPLYVHSQRDLEDDMQSMQPAFDGKETEQNWMLRDKNILKLRRLNQGNAPKDYLAVFQAGIKSSLDGILKVVNSLRTTMCINGCHLLQELARTLGSALDSMVDVILQTCIKMCSATKQITAQNGNVTVEIIFAHVSYNVRLMQHIWNASQDKNVQPRLFAARWLKCLIQRHKGSKTHFEHGGGLEVADKCIKRGLSDANPKVRESMRITFWDYAKVWPDRSDMIMNSLDSKSKQLLQRDPSNPNASTSMAVSFTSSVGPTNPRAGSTRSVLQEQIAAQRRAAARDLPERPSSAQSTFSPTKSFHTPTARGSSTLSGLNSNRNIVQASVKQHSTAIGTSGQGSLMSGPVRRPKRPDVPRPATADPYAQRKVQKIDTPPRSPQQGQHRFPRAADQPAGASHTKSKSTTSIQSPSLESPTMMAVSSISPSSSPSRRADDVLHSRSPFSGSSRVNRAENLNASPKANEVSIERRTALKMEARPDSSRGIEEHLKLDLSNPGETPEDDSFTLIMPNESGKLVPSGIKPSRQIFASPVAQIRITVPVVEVDRATIPATDSLESRSGPPGKESADQTEDPVVVYEDPDSSQMGSPRSILPLKPVLEELPVNGHLAPDQPGDPDLERGKTSTKQEDRSNPSEKKRTSDDLAQDKVEMLKSRRILASGIERIRSQSLDAHGFRRLQELIKKNPNSSIFDFSPLQSALCAYLEAPIASLKTSTLKAQNLKTQALSTSRAVLVTQRRQDAVVRRCPETLRALIRARQEFESSAHITADLMDAAQELISVFPESGYLLDVVAELAMRESGTGVADNGRLAIMSLNILSQLLVRSHGAGTTLSDMQKTQLGKLAVKFLSDNNAEVRKSDTEFCLSFYDSFDRKEQRDEESQRAEFWKYMKGAKEQHLNLIAYYLARRAKVQVQ